MARPQGAEPAARKLCHTLGGSFNLPHAQTHTVVLPHALAYNAPAAPLALERIAAALGRDNAPQALFDLAHDSGAPVALKELGMHRADLERACELAMQDTAIRTRGRWSASR